MIRSGDSEKYHRSYDDLGTIVKFAKLSSENLTAIAQAIYFPIQPVSSEIKLLELENDIFEEIKKGKSLYFKGGFNEVAVLCTNTKTYEIKETEISNSLMLAENLKFMNETVKCAPPKFKQRKLEHRKLCKIFHEYYECREITPRCRNIMELLRTTKYSGPDTESRVNKKFMLTFDQLLNISQCSRKELTECMTMNRAMEIDGFIRVLDNDYELRLVYMMTALITPEFSYHIQKENTLTSLQGKGHSNVIENIFDFYTRRSASGKCYYDEQLVARAIANNILQPGLKFEIDEFFTTWQEALPNGMNIRNEFLKGLGVIDLNSTSPCVKSLPEKQLPTNLDERLQTLFRIKSRWTIEEIEPYIEYFVTPSCSVADILSKFTRSMMESGRIYFVNKH